MDMTALTPETFWKICSIILPRRVMQESINGIVADGFYNPLAA